MPVGRLEPLMHLEGYVPALAGLAVAILFHALLLKTVGVAAFGGIFLVYLSALLVAAWCGYGPGILTLALMITVVPRIFVSNAASRPVNIPALIAIVLFCLLISKAGAVRRQTEGLLRISNTELERRIQDKTTELAEANMELQRQLRELQRANADLEQFAYSASHDLQEPLRMVSLFVQLIKREYSGKIDPQADEYIGQAVAGATRMDTLLKGLRSYLTISPGEVRPPLISADDVLNRCIENLQPLIESTGTRIERSRLPSVRMHAVHLEQILQNLLTNAIKYRGKDTSHVQFFATNDEAGWRFAVRDNGIGINPEYATHIFGVFKRLHTQEAYEGTGIGLAICQKIVQQYAGRIWVESSPGQGSTFFFTVPNARG